MPCALRLKALTQIFPEALYLIISREVQNNAVSLIHARKAICGHEEKGWSLNSRHEGDQGKEP